MRHPARRLAALAAAASLALPGACETPPVFESDPPDPLRVLPASRAVLVAPAPAAPHPHRYAEQLARALVAREVPASANAGSIRRAFVLRGQASEAGDAVILDWTLTEPDGGSVGDFRQRISAEAWHAPEVAREAAQRRALFEEAAARVAALLEPAQAAPPAVTPVALGAITAPGDGAGALRAALLGQLAARGVELAEAPAPEGLRLEGTVRSRPTGDGRDLAEVIWVLHGPDGRLGEVRQADAVPAGRLRRTWGPLARDIAAAAADGIVELLRQAGANPAPATPFTGY